MTQINKINLIRRVPARTPVIISYKIRNLIKNKIVCEVGCAEGDNMMLLSKYAKKVIGLDLNAERLKYAQNRKLNVQLSDYRLDSIPKVDIYYLTKIIQTALVILLLGINWPSNSAQSSQEKISFIIKVQTGQVN